MSSDNRTEQNESKTAEQIEALRDLNATYIHPVKCSYQTNSKKLVQKKNLISVIKQREMGLINFHRYPDARYREVIATMARPTFCGQFSEDGQRFLSACQDYRIRFYDTTSSKTFPRLAEITVDDVGWSILDTALSPNRKDVVYSTWSDCIYLVKLTDNEHESSIIPLNLHPESHSFSIFSLQYSVDGSEIIGGSNDTCVYVYDLHKQQRTLRVQAHGDDINAVRFIDNSNSLIVSGSDDNLILVWDRRALNESQPKPVGIFAGHTNGITFIHSRMDTRYLISNSKDQSIKLWDMRRFANEATIQKSYTISNNINNSWDYRYDAYGPRPQRFDLPGDPSVRTYRGHSVGYTLIRCYFSPAFTTGQRYIITGSSDGCIHIYDILTGSTELCLRVSHDPDESRERCVRDVSWHPYENYIISTSWDSYRAHVRWTHSFDESIDSKLSASSDPKIISVKTPHLLPNRRPTTLRRLLIQQFYGDNLDDNSDNDDDEDEDDLTLPE
ncbi:unnamed protein product [Adineta steineri]|uniref:Uncharacterized protein n=1 Tax=Adineta steineri TaxID=433720 RepID=A0A814C427_9BILA|nr:unnamed protein product [Adineta steineri]CAF3905685.1 unnamed protein product [Adineta steineri]